MKLNQDNIALGIYGRKWIIANMQETHNKVKIPILPIAKDLINKYEDHIKAKKTKTLFPTTSN